MLLYLFACWAAVLVLFVLGACKASRQAGAAEERMRRELALHAESETFRTPPSVAGLRSEPRGPKRARQRLAPGTPSDS